jgi:glycosyltransferase involved in cell wall biosynthesis
MTRLPFEKLHERLDLAFSMHGESPTLKDFRATIDLVELENKSLNKARKIITPHSEIAQIFNNKCHKLAWEMPNVENHSPLGHKILFPASAVGRKGAYEIKKLAKELNLTISFLGKNIEHENFWENVSTEKFNGDLDSIGLIIYPTFIEHQPRLILKALAKGIPIITTAACGLESSDRIKILENNDFELLKKEVVAHLKIGR